MKTLLLIDAHSLIHRAYHALPPLTAPGGEPVGALYGVSTILLKELRTLKPDYVAAAFDRPEPTFRKEMFSDYKAHRPKAEDELVSQLVEARNTFAAFGISAFEKPGYEGDDIIGTLAKRFAKKGDVRVIILTGDLDSLQLVEDDTVTVETPKKGIGETTRYDAHAVFSRYGLTPAQLPDYKGLVGDPSDNIPGVQGVGPKTASKLLAEYGTLERLLADFSPKTAAERHIMEQKETALFSKKLATIDTAVPIEGTLETLACTDPAETLVPYFTKKGFASLLERLGRSPSKIPQPAAVHTAPSKTATSVLVLTPQEILSQKEPFPDDKAVVSYGWKTLIKQGVAVPAKFFDLSVAGWLMDPEKKNVSIPELSRRFLQKTVLEPLSESDEHATLTSLHVFFLGKLKEYEMLGIAEQIEFPLIPVLAEMEKTGIAVNRTKLEQLGAEIDRALSGLTETIYKTAGVIFNINSPKQVAQILFEKLELTGGRRRTPGGQARTGKDVLEDLRGAHPVVEHILAYREHFKIRSSFITPILEAIGPDKRVHTEFLQTGTSTGRLASENPNLQNIPQESRWSQPLRDAFEAAPGFTFLSFDYSQLELRLLAHITDDTNLKEAFRKGEDIHTLTASRVLGIAKKDVDPAARRLAKTLNFGIVYGMGARAFAKTSGIPQEEARKFMDEYFRNFPSIKEWQERTKADARTFGYVANNNGRRRWFLNVRAPFLRSEMERAAINMPVQSLGADVIKRAMIETHHLLSSSYRENARLILSIHDEILLEARHAVLPELLRAVQGIMEAVLPLSVPLRVESKQGPTWGTLRPL